MGEQKASHKSKHKHLWMTYIPKNGRSFPEGNRQAETFKTWEATNTEQINYIFMYL